MNLQVGSTVGDYQVIGILGAGGMGKVYKVRNLISDRVEAMKVLLPDLAGGPELAERFLREIKVQASLEHPNIAALHTAVRGENQLLMLMEFVDGVTLDQKLREGVLSVNEAIDYVTQVLAALDYAHQRGVVHRDIKPANMMLTGGGVVKLMDFGIAKASFDHKLTMTGTTMGSLYYMSPEQIQGAATLDGRSDLYSVGICLYEFVTGRRPFDGDSQFAVMAAHLEKAPVPPVLLDPSLPQALSDMILMSVSREASQRFQTAAAFRNALGSFAAADQAPAMAAAMRRESQGSAPAEPHGKRQSKRAVWVAIGTLATAAVVVGVIQFAPRKGIIAAPSIAPLPPTSTAPLRTTTSAAPSTPAPPPAINPPTTVEAGRAKSSATPLKPVPVQSAPSVEPRSTSTPQPSVQLEAPIQTAGQQPQPPAQQAPPLVQQSQPASPGRSREEIQMAREQFMLLNTRASGIRTSLQTLQRSQAASGLNLRGDMQEAAALMNNYLGAANSAIDAGDLPSAKSMMEKAERQIEKLEKFLNR